VEQYKKVINDSRHYWGSINCTSFLIQEYFPLSSYALRITFLNTKEMMNHKLSFSHLQGHFCIF